MHFSLTKTYLNKQKVVVWEGHYLQHLYHTDLYHAKGIASNLYKEYVIIKKRFLAADYPHKFINSVINMFTEKENKKEEHFIPQNFFRNTKTSNFN